jgi:hypothetical protein
VGSTLRVGSEVCDRQTWNLIGDDFGEDIASKNNTRVLKYFKKPYERAKNIVDLKYLRYKPN